MLSHDLWLTIFVLIDCYKPLQQYTQNGDLDMPGEERSIEHGVEDCQSRCRDAVNCSYFTFFLSDSTCHLQNSTAKIHSAYTLGLRIMTLAGPNTCDQGIFHLF